MTSNDLLKRLDVVSLEACLTKWVFSKFESLQALKTQHLQGVAEDLLKLRREHWTMKQRGFSLQNLNLQLNSFSIDKWIVDTLK